MIQLTKVSYFTQRSIFSEEILVIRGHSGVKPYCDTFLQWHLIEGVPYINKLAPLIDIFHERRCSYLLLLICYVLRCSVHVRGYVVHIFIKKSLIWKYSVYIIQFKNERPRIIAVSQWREQRKSRNNPTFNRPNVFYSNVINATEGCVGSRNDGRSREDGVIRRVLMRKCHIELGW